MLHVYGEIHGCRGPAHRRPKASMADSYINSVAWTTFSLIEPEVKAAISQISTTDLFRNKKNVEKDGAFFERAEQFEDHIELDDSDEEDSEIVDARVLLRSLMRTEAFKAECGPLLVLSKSLERQLFSAIPEHKDTLSGLKIMAKAKFNGLSISKILKDFPVECGKCVEFVKLILCPK